MHPLRFLMLATLLGVCLRSQAQTPPAPGAPATSPGPVPPPGMFMDPAEACAHAGGHYLGDLKCGMPGGKTMPIISGVDAFHAQQSTVRIAYGTPRSWALATTAITFQYNGSSSELLAGTAATPDAIQNERRLLAQWWSIRNRDDLLKTLSWLQYTGHRKAFEDQGRRVDELDDRQFEFALETPSLDEQTRNELGVVRRYHKRLGNTGILGWDLVRYISLCRWGYLVGFLSEDEAWERIMSAALTLQRSFGSWKELQDNFLIGRQYWSLQQTRQTGAGYQTILDHMLKDPSGPLLRNSWSMDLHVGTPLPTFAFGANP